MSSFVCLYQTVRKTCRFDYFNIFVILLILLEGSVHASEFDSGGTGGSSPRVQSELCQAQLEMESVDSVRSEGGSASELSFEGSWLLRNYALSYNGSDGFEILRAVARVFIEYPKSYLKVAEQGVYLAVPDAQFERIFKRSYAEVIAQLSFVTVVVSTEFESGKVMDSYEPFLLAIGNESCGEASAESNAPSNLCFVLHPNFGKLMKFYKEPAVVAMYSEEGSVFHREERYRKMRF